MYPMGSPLQPVAKGTFEVQYAANQGSVPCMLNSGPANREDVRQIYPAAAAARAPFDIPMRPTSSIVISVLSAAHMSCVSS